MGPCTNTKHNQMQLYFEGSARKWCTLGYVPYLPLISERNPIPPNLLWGMYLELIVDMNHVCSTRKQWHTRDLKSTEIQKMYFHVIDIRDVFKTGFGGNFKVHRDYFYQLKTQQGRAFTSLALARETDPRDPVEWEKRLYSANIEEQNL